MKNLLKFSVTWRRADDKHLILKLVEADSIESRVKPEEETLEAFAEGLETLSFVLEEKDSELRRGEVVTLEFIGNDLKYIYIRGKKFLVIRCNEVELYLLKPVQMVQGIEHLPEVFQHRIKMLAEYAGPDFLSWDLQQEIQGCELAAAVYNQILTDSEGFYRGFNVTKRYYDNRWTPENPSNTYPRASWSAKANNARVSTRFLEDGSYLRLKNLQIGYSIPTEKMKGIDRFRIYLAATNLFTITKYSGFDPEMTVSANSESEGDRANGIDWGTYPLCRTFTFGINLTF